MSDPKLYAERERERVRKELDELYDVHIELLRAVRPDVELTEAERGSEQLDLKTIRTLFNLHLVERLSQPRVFAPDVPGGFATRSFSGAIALMALTLDRRDPNYQYRSRPDGVNAAAADKLIRLLHSKGWAAISTALGFLPSGGIGQALALLSGAGGMVDAPGDLRKQVLQTAATEAVQLALTRPRQQPAFVAPAAVPLERIVVLQHRLHHHHLGTISYQLHDPMHKPRAELKQAEATYTAALTRRDELTVKLAAMPASDAKRREVERQLATANASLPPLYANLRQAMAAIAPLDAQASPRGAQVTAPVSSFASPLPPVPTRLPTIDPTLVRPPQLGPAVPTIEADYDSFFRGLLAGLGY